MFPIACLPAHMKKMVQVPNFLRGEVAPVIRHPDAGESIETYEIDVQTFSWPRMYHILGPVYFLKNPNLVSQNSESSETYEAEVESCYLNAVKR